VKADKYKNEFLTSAPFLELYIATSVLVFPINS